MFNRTCQKCRKKFQSKKQPDPVGCRCPFTAFASDAPPLLYQEDIDKTENLISGALIDCSGRRGLNLRKMIDDLSHEHVFDAPTLKKVLWLPNQDQKTLITVFIGQEGHLMRLLRARTELIEPLFLGAILTKRWTFFEALLSNRLLTPPMIEYFLVDLRGSLALQTVDDQIDIAHNLRRVGLPEFFNLILSFEGVRLLSHWTLVSKLEFPIKAFDSKLSHHKILDLKERPTVEKVFCFFLAIKAQEWFFLQTLALQNLLTPEILAETLTLFKHWPIDIQISIAANLVAAKILTIEEVPRFFKEVYFDKERREFGFKPCRVDLSVFDPIYPAASVAVAPPKKNGEASAAGAAVPPPKKIGQASKAKNIASPPTPEESAAAAEAERDLEEMLVAEEAVAAAKAAKKKTKKPAASRAPEWPPALLQGSQHIQGQNDGEKKSPTPGADAAIPPLPGDFRIEKSRTSPPAPPPLFLEKTGPNQKELKAAKRATQEAQNNEIADHFFLRQAQRRGLLAFQEERVWSQAQRKMRKETEALQAQNPTTVSAPTLPNISAKLLSSAAPVFERQSPYCEKLILVASFLEKLVKTHRLDVYVYGSAVTYSVLSAWKIPHNKIPGDIDLIIWYTEGVRAVLEAFGLKLDANESNPPYHQRYKGLVETVEVDVTVINPRIYRSLDPLLITRLRWKVRGYLDFQLMLVNREASQFEVDPLVLQRDLVLAQQGILNIELPSAEFSPNSFFCRVVKYYYFWMDVFPHFKPAAGSALSCFLNPGWRRVYLFHLTNLPSRANKKYSPAYLEMADLVFKNRKEIGVFLPEPESVREQLVGDILSDFFIALLRVPRPQVDKSLLDFIQHDALCEFWRLFVENPQDLFPFTKDTGILWALDVIQDYIHDEIKARIQLPHYEQPRLKLRALLAPSAVPPYQAAGLVPLPSTAIPP